MKSILRFFSGLLLFFLLLFFSQRVIFILFQWQDIRPIPFTETLSVFRQSFFMDLASACAILIIPFLVTGVHLFKENRFSKSIIRHYATGLVLLSGFINICDAALFRSWGTRMNSQAVSYLAFPKEATANAFSMQYFPLLIAFLIVSFILIKIYKKFFPYRIEAKTSIFLKIAFILLMPFILIVGIRGGFQRYPLDRSWVYFSRHSVLNQAAMNSSWNFIHAVTDPVEMKNNPYIFFSKEDAERIVRSVHNSSSDSVISILNSSRPNILLIMLESFSAEVIEPLGGRADVTPNISRLCKEGLLFTNFYTPGFRTEQGLAALVSGFPSQPKTTVIRQFGKFDKLPSLARSLDSAGYYSSYYYGGNLHFAFTGSYLQAAGFDKIIGENDFEIKRKTNWGAYDEELFGFFNRDMKNPGLPFFSIIMTSTNHEPFDAKVEKINKSIPGDWCGDYINTVHYTDKCLGDLVDGLKKQSWYDSTLVVIVADHAHSCPEKHEYNSAPRHRIPFLILGGALKEEFRGKTYDKIASQVDFAATILGQLKIGHPQFYWSKNIFDPASKEFTFYAFDEGFGIICREEQIVYDYKQNKIISSFRLRPDTKNGYEESSVPVNDSMVIQGKAYLQKLIDEYLGLSEGSKFN